MAVIVLNGQTEGFKHLDFVTIPEIGAAVAALLTAGQGLERQAKLQMEGAVTERLLGHRAHLEQFEGKKFAAFPRIGIAAVEEHQRTFRGLGQECRRLPDDPFRTELLSFSSLPMSSPATISPCHFSPLKTTLSPSRRASTSVTFSTSGEVPGSPCLRPSSRSRCRGR